MKHAIKTIFALAACSAALSACTTPAYVSPVEVTRFTGAAPAQLGQGTISVEAAPGRDSASIEFTVFRDQLERELSVIGYHVVASRGSQVAMLDIARTVAEGERRSPVSVGGGAGVGSYGSGVGLGVGIDLSGSPPDRIDTQVAVSIRRATGGANLWEGRARFTATDNSDYVDPALAADRAIAALFTDFPGQSGETIEITPEDQ
ncbi:hypothetical protein GCM10009127_06150 [Alteraurantiacibacter aestuarii]|uniref:DUF4136 domain-containing protein n=1 Tax=Alteraurantiacibacter aestuarii TaxID=650004 RepID=A0A844ZN52_9SPHN|nr:DUF4136 domain-containing protein [Alteraurantiacibacter aestuarii]MXO89093.1 DUF4136 domain-containing protein [Alteraurantiacibacter aestuarii]